VSCLGVLFALNKWQVDALRAVPRPERPSYIAEGIEEDFFDHHQEDLCQLDKSWDAMHRALTGGTLRFGGSRPLSGVIMGGEVLYGNRAGEEDYIAVLKPPDKVRKTVEAMEKLTDEALRRCYFAIPEADYGFPLSEEDFQYTCAYFRDSLPFWRWAAARGRYVLFTADQ
jgi:hypothetical protein